jgi:hypothetical protein
MSNATTTYGRAAEILKRGIDIVRVREIERRLKRAEENLVHCKRETGSA